MADKPCFLASIPPHSLLFFCSLYEQLILPVRQAYIRAPRRRQYPSRTVDTEKYAGNGLKFWCGSSQRIVAVATLADAGLGEFDRHAQLDLGQHDVERGSPVVLGQPLGRDLEPASVAGDRDCRRATRA